ncbi:peptide-N4-(N-acetyl-beta-glucosaminyl)asparagine amidase A [Paraphoma chrysanthemicola]|uniref:Peptide-N4-(N-acetyl-beta-glucosaminyl)asparagine amidase A n=1 Tax=Paraphoma chrysanthemicola TaxID=798071 RepID=A0A8K0RGB8_9PLEO|nr:peptide-N4-(N-acetyl-beta-glucosaminyl)asparagine amidase A [Paraphoma chrysanthemicola]
MGGNTEYIAGHGYLSLGQAVHVAQNSEGGVDQNLARFLETKLASVWAKLNAQPTSYVLPPDEFALLNYYRTRFGDNEIVRSATKRFWDNHKAAQYFCLAFDYFMRSAFSRDTSGDGVHGVHFPDIGPLLSLFLSKSAWKLCGRTLLYIRRWPLVCLSLMLIAISQSTLAALLAPPRNLTYTPTLSKLAANESSVLECLQVAAPVPNPAGSCQQVLMVHTFAFSYGQPFVAQYAPPDCEFNHATFNFTVTSAGRQFDRLALMFLDDTEVFRTSTAEPTRDGIIWSYLKDMSLYLTLLKTPHKMIFDLGNLVDDTYTGVWNATLTATFYSAEQTFHPADVIVPISAQRSGSNGSSAFVVPESRALSSLKVPRNAKKAVFSILACGQAAEEFWWSNVLSSDTRVFGDDAPLYGHSPFREVQVLIDGELAGVAWPFPIIFTGGIVPGFWRPVVGIDAFDLQEDEIDISPFLPRLTDDQLHTFEIRVMGLDDDGNGNAILTERIESNWVVTGKIFVWLDSGINTVTGTVPTLRTADPLVKLQSTRHLGRNGSIQSLDYSIQVSRRIDTTATLYTSHGAEITSWQQRLEFSNSGTLDNNGNNQRMRQDTSGRECSSSGYVRTFEYPLWVISAYEQRPGGNLTIDGMMGRGKDVDQTSDLAPSFRGSHSKNWQNGTASYVSIPAEKRAYGTGATEQFFTLTGINDDPHGVLQGATNNATSENEAYEALYRRHVLAVNNSIVYNDEEIGCQHEVHSWVAIPDNWATMTQMHEFASQHSRALLGRGPH